jgi:uncharacterized protein DUF3179
MRMSRRNRWFAGIVMLAAIGTGIGFVLAQTAALPGHRSTTVACTSNPPEVYTNDAGVRYIVDPSLLIAGGPPKDGIPSIDNPLYISMEEADEWIADDELVLALIYKGVKRVYPLQILVWHEIVNDVVAGDPLLITFCPLCGSGIAYERTIDGNPVAFGTSGFLYNSNLVMYDRQTETYWSQINGMAIVGELSGQELTPISLDTVVWKDWKLSHSDSEVLSQNTGFARDYGRDPYGSYHAASYIWFPVAGQDDRIHPKTVVFGVEIDGVYVAYCEEDLLELGAIDDYVNGVRIRISRDTAGIVSVLNLSTQEAVVKERDYWFAWYAFHPDTHLFVPSD